MKSKRTKELLLKKATDLFYEYSYLKTPIRKITESLQVKNTIIYYYFKSKDELLFSIINGISYELIHNLEDIIERFDNPLERVCNMIYFHIVILKRKKKEVKIFVEDKDKLPPEMLEKVKATQRKIYDIYSYQFKRLLRAKKIRKVEIPVIVFSLFAMINWTYRWFKEDGSLTIEEVAEKTIRIFLCGILSEQDRDIVISSLLE